MNWCYQIGNAKIGWEMKPFEGLVLLSPTMNSHFWGMGVGWFHLVPLRVSKVSPFGVFDILQVIQPPWPFDLPKRWVGHLYNLWKGHVNSPSQKGRSPSQNCQATSNYFELSQGGWCKMFDNTCILRSFWCSRQVFSRKTHGKFIGWKSGPGLLTQHLHPISLQDRLLLGLKLSCIRGSHWWAIWAMKKTWLVGIYRGLYYPVIL